MFNTSGLTIAQMCQIFQEAQSLDIGVVRTNLKSLLPLIYAVPSLLLSLRIIVMLIKGRKKEEFSSSFYNLFVATSIVEFLYYIVANYFDRLMVAPATSFLYEWIPESGFAPSLIYFLSTYLMFAAILSPIMLSSNRFTAVVFPVQHKKIWLKMTGIVLLLFFLIPIAFSFQIWLTNCIKCKLLNLNNPNEAYFYILQDNIDGYPIPLSLLMQLVSFISSISCFIMNAITISTLFYHRKMSTGANGNYPNERNKKAALREMKLLALSLLMFFNETMLSMIQLGFFILGNINATTMEELMAANNWYNLLFEIQRFVVDLICLTPPWCILLMSSSVRAKIIGKFKKHEIQLVSKAESPIHAKTITPSNKIFQTGKT